MVNSTPNFLSLVKTTRDRDDLIVHLKSLVQTAFKNNHSPLATLRDKSLPAVLSEELQSRLQGSTDNRQELVDQSNELLNLLEKLPVVSVTLAYSPTESQTEKIVRLVRNKFSPEAVIEIHLDRQILGGATVSFSGKYFDVSLLKIIDQSLDKYNLTAQKYYG